MRPLYKLIKPETSEVILFTISGFALLIFSNMSRLWDHYSEGISFSEVLEAQTYGTVIQDFLLEIESHIDPRLVDFTVWMIVGAMSISVVLFFQRFIEDTSEEVEYTQKIVNPVMRSKEWSHFLIKSILRIAGLVLLLIWIRIFFGAIFSELSQEFFTSVSKLDDINSWVTIAKTIVLSSIGIYTIAICLRLISLRTRVFG